MSAVNPPDRSHCRAVLFDFDGTLADTYPGITASVNHVRAAYGLPPLTEDEVRWHVGRGPAYLLERTVPQGDNAANVARYKAHHPSVMRSGTRLFPGVADTLRTLHTRGLRLAVCSNKPKRFTLELLDYFGLAALMALVLGPEDVQQLKPAPDMLLRALEQLNLQPPEALYVGDMVVDIQTARSAGVAVWVVPTGSERLPALQAGQPDRLLQGLRELPDLLSAQTSKPASEG